MRKRSPYFAYKRAKATDIRTPSIDKNKSMRGLLFTRRAMIDTANVNWNTKKTVFSLSRKHIKRKGGHGTDKANQLSYSWSKKECLSTTKRIANTWRKENSAIFCFILFVLLGHLQQTIHHRSQLSLPLEATISTAFCFLYLR